LDLPVRQLFSILMCCAVLAPAQTPYATTMTPSSVVQEIPANRGAAALWQSLKKLRTRASLIMITAHPDDEDGGMLTYESRGRGTRVAMLTLNRGEGGANAMSPDFYDALGLVRTEELLKAGQHYGVEQYFTRVIDYGFSKTMDESIKRWTRDRVLYDVVRVVRMVRPLVITSVFVGGPSDGHGNHQTAGAMAQAVYKAAGDPSVFPDQIRAGLKPWNPVKHYGRRPGVQLSTQVEVPQGTYDPLLGASYAQLAREGLGWQKSQNGGPSIPKAGEINSAYHRFGPPGMNGEKDEHFFAGIDISLAGIAELVQGGEVPPFLKAGLANIDADIRRAAESFSAVQLEKSASALAMGLKETMALLDQVERGSGLNEISKHNIRHELEIKRAQFNNALALSLGLSVAATVAPEREPNARMLQFFGDPETFRVAVPGQSFGVKVHVVNPSPAAVTLVRTSVTGAADEAHGVTIANNKPVDTRVTVTVPGGAAPTRPYFRRPDIEQAYYDLADEALLHQPGTPYPYAALADFVYDGAPIRLGAVVQTVKRVTGLGTVYEPLVVGPAIGVAIAPRYGVVPFGSKSFPVSVSLHSNVKGPASGTVKLDLPSGWTSVPASAPFSTGADGEDRAVTFEVTPSNLTERVFEITAVAEHAGKEYREGYSIAGYPGLRASYLYRPAVYKTSGVDVKIAPGMKIAYIAGSGDEVPASLEQIGVKVSFLAAADIANGNLNQYDAIVLGIRAYAARPELATYNARLLDYVKQGGTMIVQYNTPEFDKNFGPYPYTMGNNPEEVTDEASKVEILAPDNPLFQWPNKITAKDFEGWVEERGSKWMRSWDPQYQALLEAHDDGQDPQKGGMLYAKYGKGVWVYCGWAFYRQLPEGVPGGFRIFANLLSLVRNPAR
jgi:LmbE family N-acetylglucosaminyl deacetylase